MLTSEDIIALKGMVDYCERRSQGKLMAVDYLDLLRKLDLMLKETERE